MMRSTLSVVALFCLALALPAVSTSSTLINATYDDYQAITGTAVPNTISIYDGVQYSGFDVSNTTAEKTGLQPHSPPNFLLTTAIQQAEGIPTLSIEYSDTPYSSMSLFSFWFGCFQTTGEGVVSTTAGCTVQVTSYHTGSTTAVAIANFEYAPSVTTTVVGAMIEAILPPGFTNVSSITIQQSPLETVGFGGDNLLYDLNW